MARGEGGYHRNIFFFFNSSTDNGFKFFVRHIRCCIVSNYGIKYFFSGSDGCEDGVPGRFETTQQEAYRQPQQQVHEPFHIQLQSPASVKQDSMPMSFLQQQPFGIFGQGNLKKKNSEIYIYIYYIILLIIKSVSILEFTKFKSVF